VGLFSLLGDQSLPTLRKTATSTDKQTRYLAKATIDALTKGSHYAFGYLSSKVKLTAFLSERLQSGCVLFGKCDPCPFGCAKLLTRVRRQRLHYFFLGRIELTIGTLEILLARGYCLPLGSSRRARASAFALTVFASHIGSSGIPRQERKVMPLFRPAQICGQCRNSTPC